MKFIKHGHLSKTSRQSIFSLIVDGAELQMTREEAEQLFVNIGHALQDDDIEQYAKESTEGDQPDVRHH